MMQKPLVKADIDKIEYDIESDPDSKSNSIIEMLRKVPLVTVDGEDNVTVNGSSSFKVYVNGRPNNMMTKNPKEVLKSMPANSIKKIEVITDPGPKYDAEGVGGILNIVTIGGGIEGYTLTLNGNVSNRGAGGGLFGTIKSGKLTVSARYNYNYDGNRTGYSESSRMVTEENVSADASNMASSSENKSHGNFSREASSKLRNRLAKACHNVAGPMGRRQQGQQYVGNDRNKSAGRAPSIRLLSHGKEQLFMEINRRWHRLSETLQGERPHVDAVIQNKHQLTRATTILTTTK